MSALHTGWLRAIARVVALVIIVTGGSVACGGVTDPIATFETVTFKSTVAALNGSPIAAATAINTATALTVRAEVAYDFDVAFDLDDLGRPVLLTQRAVGSPAGNAGHQVALQPLDDAFDAVTEAPITGWTADSIYTASIGEVVAVRASVAACQFELAPYVYSKMVVDSVSVAQRKLWLTVVTDPNCGFRSLEPGRPRR